MALVVRYRWFVRSRWNLLFLVLAVGILTTGCRSQTLHPAPTVTPLPFYATAAADPGWHTLQQRPLHLPTLMPGASCPTTPGHLVRADLGIGLGTGPVYPILGETTGTSQQAQTQSILHYVPTGRYGWGGQKVLWIIHPSYQGFVLIRGQQLDGPRGLRFNGGLDQLGSIDLTTTPTPPLPALRLVAPVPRSTDLWANWPSLTRLHTPGCYAYQVDGNSLSIVIVFQAVPAA